MTARPLDGEILNTAQDDGYLYRGVRTRRIVAFFIDYLLIGLLMIPVAIVVALLGVMTLGLGWLLFGILAPLTALLYVAMTLGGRRQASPTSPKS